MKELAEELVPKTVCWDVTTRLAFLEAHRENPTEVRDLAYEAREAIMSMRVAILNLVEDVQVQIPVSTKWESVEIALDACTGQFNEKLERLLVGLDE